MQKAAMITQKLTETLAQDLNLSQKTIDNITKPMEEIQAELDRFKDISMRQWIGRKGYR